MCHNETGVYTYRDGSRYVGTFDHGDPRGQGILYYANGDQYEGKWDDVTPQGRGLCTSPVVKYLLLCGRKASR
ncbi:MAG: hypothetical protein IPO69_09055 [Saprospiraceae bacterium]|nr:hypothetical protein [Saprospiraceae bacterium]